MSSGLNVSQGSMESSDLSPLDLGSDLGFSAYDFSETAGFTIDGNGKVASIVDQTTNDVDYPAWASGTQFRGSVVDGVFQVRDAATDLLFQNASGDTDVTGICVVVVVAVGNSNDSLSGIMCLGRSEFNTFDHYFALNPTNGQWNFVYGGGSGGDIDHLDTGSSLATTFGDMEKQVLMFTAHQSASEGLTVYQNGRRISHAKDAVAATVPANSHDRLTLGNTAPNAVTPGVSNDMDFYEFYIASLGPGEPGENTTEEQHLRLMRVLCEKHDVAWAGDPI